MALANTIAPACKADTLSDYEHSLPGGQCSIGILIFQQFTFSSSSTPVPDGAAPTPLSDSQIMLTPTGNLSFGGFTISPVSGVFGVLLGQTETYNIGFQFVIDPAPVVAGADLSLDPPFGDVTVTQSYCNDSAFLDATHCTGNPITAAQTLMVHNPDKTTDSKTFNPPANIFGNVQTKIFLNGAVAQPGCPVDPVTQAHYAACFDSTTGTARVVGAAATTPEPGSIALAFTGLVLAGGVSRFRKRRRLD